MEGCYPKWVYCAGKEPLLVKSAEQMRALGSEWVESPALLPEVKQEPEPIRVEIVKPRAKKAARGSKEA